MKKILVSGCFDMLHSGHVEFLAQAARLGDQLFVCIGSDKTVFDLKGRPPVCNENERKFMLENLRMVDEVRISRGSGHLDFLPEFEEVKPDVLVVNEDGQSESKAALCAKYGIEYRISKRLPHDKLPFRSTTDLRTIETMPFRIDLCGGWLDQPMVSRHHPGAVITASLAPTVQFNNRSGMASSTRNNALKLWGPRLPVGDPLELGRQLFAFDNPPGTIDIAGSQDALGITCPGLNRHDYAGKFWPEKTTAVHDDEVLDFLEKHICLVPLGPREGNYQVTNNRKITAKRAQKLAGAADFFWQACLEKDLEKIGRGMAAGASAQWAMFPNMVFPGLLDLIDKYENMGALGWKLSGAGGGGYLTLIAEKPFDGAISLKIRRK